MPDDTQDYGKRHLAGLLGSWRLVPSLSLQWTVVSEAGVCNPLLFRTSSPIPRESREFDKSQGLNIVPGGDSVTHPGHISPASLWEALASQRVK